MVRTRSRSSRVLLSLLAAIAVTAAARIGASWVDGDALPKSVAATHTIELALPMAKLADEPAVGSALTTTAELTMTTSLWSL